LGTQVTGSRRGGKVRKPKKGGQLREKKKQRPKEIRTGGRKDGEYVNYVRTEKVTEEKRGGSPGSKSWGVAGTNGRNQGGKGNRVSQEGKGGNLFLWGSGGTPVVIKKGKGLGTTKRGKKLKFCKKVGGDLK